MTSARRTQEKRSPAKVTMRDVARQAGVSMMTVSRVVNNKGEISAATRQLVQEVIDRLGYRPSHIARGLATNRTGTLGLIVPDNANPFFSELTRAAEELAFAAGYNVFLCNTAEETERELASLFSLEQKRVDGLLVCSPRLKTQKLEHALKRHRAVVLFNRPLEYRGFGLVMVDDQLGGRIATTHLVETGHRTIGFLTGPPTSHSGRQRLTGYQEVLASKGIESQAGWTKPCKPSIEGGKRAALTFLQAHPECTALLCYNDLVAIGALQACDELDRSVPTDLAIVGFDDIPLAALVTPPLTTCAVPLDEIGRTGMETLIKLVEDEKDAPEPTIIQPTLVIRSSAPATQNPFSEDVQMKNEKLRSGEAELKQGGRG